MRIINSLTETEASAADFPIYFWDEWGRFEQETNNKRMLLCVDDEQSVVAFTVWNIHFLKAAQYLYAPIDSKGQRLSPECEKQFLDEFHRFLKKQKIADVIYPPSHVVVFRSIPSKAVYFKLGMMVVDLTLPEQEIFGKISKHKKAEIKRGKHHPIEIEWGEQCLKDFHTAYECTVNKKQIENCPLEYFENILKTLGKDAVTIGVARLNGNVEGSVFCLKDKHNIYPLSIGTTNNPQYEGSSKVLLWNLYLRSKEEGLSRYVAGGFRYGLKPTDDLYNVHHAKLKMGAEIEDGYHFIKVLNPFKYNLFSLALKCKSILAGKEFSFVNTSGVELKKSN